MFQNLNPLKFSQEKEVLHLNTAETEHKVYLL